MNNRPILAYGTATVESSLHTRSVVDFLSSYLKPHVTKRKSKERGHRGYGSVMDISSDHAIDFKGTMHKQILFITSETGNLPKWFDTNSYFEKCWANYIKYLEKNKEVKKYITKLLRRDITEAEQKLDTIYLALAAIEESMIKAYPNLHKNAMIEFLDSDLPFEVFNLFNLSYLNAVNVVGLMRKKVDKFQASYHMLRGNVKKLNMAANEYERVIQPLLLKFQIALEMESLFKFYIKVNNANKLEDMFELIPLTTTRLEHTKFIESFSHYKELTYGFAEFLYEKYNVRNSMISDVGSTPFLEFRNGMNEILVNYA